MSSFYNPFTSLNQIIVTKMHRIIHVRSENSELIIIRELFREYEKELNTDLCFQGFPEELENPLKKYGPPKGALFLGYWNDEPAGCIALTAMQQRGYCEMKRLYVRPEYRRFGIGRILVNRLIETALSENYQFMRLDTFKKLQSAIRLYESFGFGFIEPYYSNPYTDVVYMEKAL
jgi:ribosomal protein S18 acetylase RimI-like enzyme